LMSWRYAACILLLQACNKDPEQTLEAESPPQDFQPQIAQPEASEPIPTASPPLIPLPWRTQTGHMPEAEEVERWASSPSMSSEDATRLMRYALAAETRERGLESEEAAGPPELNGTLTVVTVPSGASVRVLGDTRSSENVYQSPVDLTGLDANVPNLVEVSFPLYRTARQSVAPLGMPGSIWRADEDGSAVAELNIPLALTDEGSQELRLQERALETNPEGLAVQLVVNSEPPGATAILGGHQLIGADGPLVTPGVADSVQIAGEVVRLTIPESPVLLSVEAEGFAPAEMVITREMFGCQNRPNSGTSGGPAEYCLFRFSTPTLNLVAG
ncbi:MAG: hypothetical protein KC561_20980, partial [Myxococcales bacterium]|nr:hypothetical protein [Myxococcales bacterium]